MHRGMSSGAEHPAITPEAATRIFLRPIATPFPLGFLGLACATLLLSGRQLGWFSPPDGREVALVILAVGAPLLLLASIFGFLARDTLAATGLGVSGATWLLIGLSTLLRPAPHTDHALGVFLLMAAAAVAVPALPSAAMKVIPALVLMLTAVRFLLTGLYELTASTTIEDIAGTIGLILVAAAVYAALALEVESAKRHTVLPVLRRGMAREAVSGSLADQVTRIEHEPGVREQL